MQIECIKGNYPLLYYYIYHFQSDEELSNPKYTL